MAQRIKSDTLQALAAWKAGKPVRSLHLGHVHRMQDRGQHSPVIDFSVRLSNDQERAHAYCFHLIDLFKINGIPVSHELFLEACDEYEKPFREADDSLTAEELDAAESLAWKALLVGWRHAIDGHSEARYIEVSRPQVPVTETAT